MGNLERAFGIEDRNVAPAFDANWRWYVARTEPGHEQRARDGLMGRRQYGTASSAGRLVARATPAYYLTREGKRIVTTAPLKVYLPEIPRRRLAGRKMRVTLVPMLPGYLLLQCELTSEIFERVRSTEGIMEHHPFLSHDGRPVAVPAAAVEIIRRKECQLTEKPPADFSVGQAVFVSLSGSRFGLDDYAGRIEEITQLVSRGRVKVAMQLFAATVPVDVDISQVRAA